MKLIEVLALITLFSLVFIFIFIILYTVAVEIINLFLYKNRTGLLAVNRFRNKIDMIYSFVTVISYYKTKNKTKRFYKDCLRLIGKLDKSTEYKTFTHEKIIERMKERKDIQIIEEIYCKKKRLIIPKLLIGNIKDLKEKEKFYNIKFKKV